MRYVITANWGTLANEDVLCYHEGNKLNDGSKGDGYFYTSIGTLADCIYENTPEHPFIFESRKEARELIKKIDLHNVSHIREFPFVI